MTEDEVGKVAVDLVWDHLSDYDTIALTLAEESPDIEAADFDRILAVARQYLTNFRATL